jgi:hypothetical protein
VTEIQHQKRSSHLEPHRQKQSQGKREILEKKGKRKRRLEKSTKNPTAPD